MPDASVHESDSENVRRRIGHNDDIATCDSRRCVDCLIAIGKSIGTSECHVMDEQSRQHDEQKRGRRDQIEPILPRPQTRTTFCSHQIYRIAETASMPMPR